MRNITIRSVVVSTADEEKLQVVKNTLNSLGLADTTVTGVDLDSAAILQPMDRGVLEQCAKKQAAYAQHCKPTAAIALGIKQGVIPAYGERFHVTCVAMLVNGGQDEPSLVGDGGLFPLPEWMITRSVRLGTGICQLVRLITKGEHNDPIRYLSGGQIKREHQLEQALRCVLIPLLYQDTYQEPADMGDLVERLGGRT